MTPHPFHIGFKPASDGDAVLLVGHGTRDSTGVAGFFDTARSVADELAPLAVEACFLEFAEPAIAEGIARLAQRGVRRVNVMPLMLLAAGHVKRDIPATVADAARNHPGLDVRYAGHLGCHPAIVRLSDQRYREAIVSCEHVPDRETRLLMVGRGSRDPNAGEEMRQFAQLRAQSGNVDDVETCFCALAAPLLRDRLAEVAAAETPRVVIQPHLLFPGRLFDQIERQVSEVANRRPNTEWILVPPLGPHPLLVEAVADLVAR